MECGITYFHSVTTIVHAMLNQKEKILNRIIEIIFEHPFDIVFSLVSHHTFKGSSVCHCEWYHLHLFETMCVCSYRQKREIMNKKHSSIHPVSLILPNTRNSYPCGS